MRRRFPAIGLSLLLSGCGGSTTPDLVAPTVAPQPGWQAPQVLSTGEIVGLSAAGDGRGAAVAVWTDRIGYRLASSTFTPPAGWGPVETLADDVLVRGGGSARVTLSGNGSSVVTWLAEATDSVRARRRASILGGWEDTAVLADFTPEVAPEVGMADDGTAVVAWAGAGIEVARFLPGAGWEPSRVLAGVGYPPVLDAVVGSRGLATVPYFQFADADDGGTLPVLQTCGVHFRASGPLATSADCVTQPWRGYNTGTISAAAAPDGSTLAVWEEFGTSGYPTRAAAYWHPDSGWSARQSFGAGLGVGLTSAAAIDALGNGFVLEQRIDAPGQWAHRFERERGWLAPELLTSESDPTLAAAISLEPAGAGWAVWNEWSPHRVIARQYIPGEGWGPPSTVGLAATALYTPKVLVDGRGGCLVIWLQRWSEEPTSTAVMARQYVP